VKKNKKITPDEIYNYGSLRLARFGNKVLMQNNIDEKSFNDNRKIFAEDYPLVIEKINNLVFEIRDLVSIVEPLDLMHHNYFHYIMETSEIRSEHELSEKQIISQRMVDYVQSIIASTPQLDKHQEITHAYAENLKEKLTELYRLLSVEYLLKRTFHEQLTNSEYNSEFDSIYVQALMHWIGVRGNRYLIHNIPHLTSLLIPHDEIFQELFAVSVDEFLEGLANIQNSLTRGLSDAMKILRELKIKLENLGFDSTNSSTEEFIKRACEINEDNELSIEKYRAAFGKLFSYDLFDVGKITGWSTRLLRELSYAPGENTEFFQEGAYCGWPLRLEPIRLRPFLYINEKCYCFDLISLMDNIYRVIQKTINRLKPSYEEQWNTKQKEVSEKLPIQLLREILPLATTFESVYFRWFGTGNTHKDWQETDALLIYDDHLFVIEVKAGAFTYTSPANDFDAYINSIKNLLLKPALQSRKFINYFLSAKSVDLFDNQHNKIGVISKDDYRQVTACCITIDNFTTLASQAKNLSPIGIDVGDSPLWSLSIDDLRVYKEIFKSPYVFLHYMEERKRASISEYVDTVDELDHIGLYLTHNAYVSYAKDFGNARVVWDGYLEEIDHYINSLYARPGEVEQPLQEMPQLFKSILEISSYKTKQGFAKAISILLNLGGKERTEIDEKIKSLIKKQTLSRRATPLSSWNVTPFIIFCRQNNFVYPDHEWIINYVYQSLLLSKREEILGIVLDFNDNRLIDVDFEFVKSCNISKEKKEEIEPKLKERFESMKANYLRDKAIKKIGRNDYCPCGSGNKYKNCHG